MRRNWYRVVRVRVVVFVVERDVSVNFDSVTWCPISVRCVIKRYQTTAFFVLFLFLDILALKVYNEDPL